MNIQFNFWLHTGLCDIFDNNVSYFQLFTDFHFNGMLRKLVYVVYRVIYHICMGFVFVFLHNRV